MTAPARKASRAGGARRPHAHAWAREVVGDIPRGVVGSQSQEDRLTGYASHVVATACLKVRKQEGADACRLLLDGLILSAAHVACGASGEAPSKVLRSLADALDGPLDPVVRERSNA